MFTAAIALALMTMAPLEDKFTKTDTQVGKGETVKKGDMVTVVYKGFLKDGGKVFDENLQKAPFVFQIGAGQVIKGWDDGVVGMKVGGKRHLVIPASMAYGERGAGTDIPGGATIEFDVEVLRTEHPKKKYDLEISTLKKSTGADAKAGDTVEIHYVGKFLNDAKFDASRDRKETFSFTLGTKQVIDGFDRTVTGMKVGEVRKVVIPQSMAYGERGAGNVIPPFSTLVFEIELISIKSK